VNPDPEGALQAVGRDTKGRTTYRYSAEHTAARAAQKYDRARDFEKVLPALRRQVDKDLHSKDDDVRENAEVLYLIDKTGFRVGGENELADVKAFGATTLQSRHVRVDGDKVSFKFVGKKGVEITKTLRDKKLAEIITARKDGSQRKDPLFPTSNDQRVRDYMKEHAKDFTPKDFRTRHATAMALDLVNKIPKPTTKAAFKKARNQVGEEVASFLGNTRTMALGSYIDPTVFKKWEASQ
jgi:DNA topoisomerase-1